MQSPHYHIDNQYSTSEFAINTWVCLPSLVNKCEKQRELFFLHFGGKNRRRRNDPTQSRPGFSAGGRMPCVFCGATLRFVSRGIHSF